jgi:hypothetical protein
VVHPQMKAQIAMRPFAKIRLTLALLAAFGALASIASVAQDDPNEVPLGDVARNLRKQTPPSQEVIDRKVIDNDNFEQVMDKADNNRAQGSALKFLMAGESTGFRVSAPDVTCSLAFTANTKALLSEQYAQMELPQNEIIKLQGPATIEGDALTVTVFNNTDWHVSEVAVALTIIRKNPPADAVAGSGDMKPGTGAATAPVIAPAQESGFRLEDVRPEKKPDVTMIYRMRAAAPPSATTVFSAPLNLELAPGDEWHWAIVQAKGYPPRSYAGISAQATTLTNQATPAPAVVPPALLLPPDSPSASLSQKPQ